MFFLVIVFEYLFVFYDYEDIELFFLEVEENLYCIGIEIFLVNKILYDEIVSY